MAIIIDKEEGGDAEPCDNCESPDNEYSFAVEVGDYNFNLCEACLKDLGKAIDTQIAV